MQTRKRSIAFDCPDPPGAGRTRRFAEPAARVGHKTSGSCCSAKGRTHFHGGSVEPSDFSSVTLPRRIPVVPRTFAGLVEIDDAVDGGDCMLNVPVNAEGDVELRPGR